MWVRHACIFVKLWTVSVFSFIMAVWLLLIILMCSVHEIQPQALRPPELSVYPRMITQKDSVTLSCQATSSVSVPQCYFTLSGQPHKNFSCQTTLRATELLQMSHQSSPAKIEVMCYYIAKLGEKYYASPYSDTSSVTIHILRRPQLTVNPAVITETDSVTLNCQTPSSVSVSQCFIYTGRQEKFIGYSCLKTLTGTELLKMSHQSSPALVDVYCFYTVKLEGLNSPSPHSETSSIIIHTSLPPKLTVNPPAITKTESVTLNCQTPSSVSVSECYFYTVRSQNVRDSSCLLKLTGTELLKMSHQSSPAVVDVYCFYIVKLGDLNSPSLRSETSSITVHSQKPKMSVQHFHGDDVLFTCSLPESANHETRCNLYFGEADHPVMTTNIRRRTTIKTEESFCQFSVTVADLLSRLRSIQQSDASCDYSLGSEPNSLSPRSNRSNLKYIVERESNLVPTQSPFTTTSVVGVESYMTQTKSTIAMTTDLTVNRLPASTALTIAKQTSGLTVGKPSKTDSSISTSPTPVKPSSVGQTLDGCSTQPSLLPPSNTASETLIWKLIVGVVGFGVSVGVILLILALLSNRGRTERCSQKRTQAIVTDDSMRMRNLNHGQSLPAGNDEAYSLITSVPVADCSVDFEKRKRQQPHTEDSDIYHVYSTIPEMPPPSVLHDMVYSSVQAH